MEKVSNKELEDLKNKLRSYKKNEIIFNEPHFTERLILREGNRFEVINNLLNPENLIYFTTEIGKYGDVKYNLYFKIDKNKTMKIPIIFSQYGKSIYIITFI